MEYSGVAVREPRSARPVPATQAVDRLRAQVDAAPVDKPELASRLVIRLHTAAKSAGFCAAGKAAYLVLHGEEAQQSHKPWVVFISFAVWAARAAYADLYGSGPADLDEGDVAADTFACVLLRFGS